MNANANTNANYAKSNKIESVALHKFSKSEYGNLLKSGDGRAERETASQKLIDYLCGKFRIPTVRVNVLDIRQPHSTGTRGTLRSKKMGQYGHAGSRPMFIRVWNLTAVKGQPVAIKTFAEVLLHEFIHHYDTFYLGIESIHTAGFYKRISDLQSKLSA